MALRTLAAEPIVGFHQDDIVRRSLEQVAQVAAEVEVADVRRALAAFGRPDRIYIRKASPTSSPRGAEADG